MVEVTQFTDGFVQSAQASGQMIFFVMTILLLLGVVMGVIAFMLYKRKFNIDIIYIPFNDEPIMTGLKARDYFVNGKDYRFKIWSAKRHKIKYNEEAIEPVHVRIHKTADGKIRRLIWMTSDSSGMLIPANLKPDLVTQVFKKISDDGKEFEEKVTSRVIRAKYTDNDVSWLAMEKDKWINIFRPKDKQMMWIFVVMCVLMLLTVGAFLWGVKKNADVADTNLVIASEQARSNALMVESLCVITQKCLNSTNSGQPGQPFNTIITT